MMNILKALFGKDFFTKILGTRTNVAKPIKFDKDSPFKKYSDDAFKDPKVLDYIEKKIREYAPYALSNRNKGEVVNFELNAKRLLEAKNKQTGSTKGMAQSIAEAMFGPLGKQVEKTSPETNIIDLKTQQPVSEKGIATLKSEVGLPEGVEPGSMADKAIKESAEYKMDQQGVESLLDPKYKSPKTTTIAEDEATDMVADIGAKAFSAADEARRRPVIRTLLLSDTRLNLPDEVRDSLINMKDLKRGADPKMDPLEVFREYYNVVDEDLFKLEEAIDSFADPLEAIDSFQKGGGFKLKKPMVRESLDDEAVEMSETKDLGDTLKDLPDDIDPDALAEGGRPGYKFGKVAKLRDLVNKKFGKDTMKTADEVKLTEDMKLKNQTNRALQELEDYREIAPKFYLRMTLKLKFPGISDDLIEKIMADDNPQRIKEVIGTLEESMTMLEKGMSPDQIIGAFKNTPRTKNSAGGLNNILGV
jgi:hypothetical protein